MAKLVRVQDETHTALVSLTKWGSSLGETIQKLIEFYLAAHPAKRKEVSK